MAASVRITVGFEGVERTLAFSRSSQAISVERAICIACSVPWGSVTRLVDATGAVYPADPALFPDGKRLQLEVVAIPREIPPAHAVVGGSLSPSAAASASQQNVHATPLTASSPRVRRAV
jgi:hypothetical protein